VPETRTNATGIGARPRPAAHDLEEGAFPLPRCRHDHRAWIVAWLRTGAAAGALVAVVATLAPLPASAQQVPGGGTDQAVADAQARADQAASAYLDALIRSQQLDAEVGELEQGIARLEQRVTELRDTARSRAIEAYKRSGAPFVAQFGDGEAAMDTARRTVLLDLLNARDDDAAAKLRSARDDLAARQRELKAAQQQQTDIVSKLRDEEQQLNTQLVTAQNERRRVAAQQAAAAAAAPAPAPAADRGVPTPAPPANYVPRAGEHPQHNDPFLVCTRSIESGGNYQAYNPSGPYYGAYQFLQSTWNSTANHAGRGELVGVDPRQASEYDQDDMAWTLYQWKGKGPWNGRC
jgi:TolA-binding protein